MHSRLLRRFFEYKPSAWALIAANVLPLLGVLFWGWDTFEIVALYWVENVIIGAINVLKMITCSSERAAIESFNSKVASSSKKLPGHGSKLFLVPFFVVHYGLFCLVHGSFILAFFQPESFVGSPFEAFSHLAAAISDRHLGWAVVGLAASHLYSFFRNYVGRGEYRRSIVVLQMFQPYVRVVVLHVAILFGAFVVIALGSNIGILAILIIGKTVLDLTMHLRERERSAQNSEPILPETILQEVPRR
jgi:hypothetical protein